VRDATVTADLTEEETQAAVSAYRAELADLFEQPGWRTGAPRAPPGLLLFGAAQRFRNRAADRHTKFM
jgi:hypothetical protein